MKFKRAIIQLVENPVLSREVRGRLRSGRMVVVLSIFMAILVVGFYLAYIAVVRSNRHNPINLSNSGRYVFMTLAIMECIMIMLIAPVFSCGTFTGEREQGTMDLLRTTLLKPGRIIAGKLASSLVLVFLLLFGSIPIFSCCLLYGGLGPFQVILTVGLLILTALFYGFLGLFFSAITKKTTTAATLSLVSSLAINLLPLGVALFLLIATNGHADEPIMFASTSSPVTSVLDILEPDIRREFRREIHVPPQVICVILHGGLALMMWAKMWSKLKVELGYAEEGLLPGMN
ncbi:MAG: ABC transporter permease subunit [Planctomycetota bacterium]|nr:ABC transporter permease subunit [Planctomycetota bacterium]MDA1142688.1 ABC transporter permease subunit [Planctomycetota bacterium]